MCSGAAVCSVNTGAVKHQPVNTAIRSMKGNLLAYCFYANMPFKTKRVCSTCSSGLSVMFLLLWCVHRVVTCPLFGQTVRLRNVKSSRRLDLTYCDTSNIWNSTKISAAVRSKVSRHPSVCCFKKVGERHECVSLFASFSHKLWHPSRG